MTHKDFALLPEQAATDTTPKEPITFTLGPRTFTALYPLPVATSLNVMSSRLAKHAIPGFVRDMLVPGDEASFDEALADKAYPVGFEAVEEVFWYLIDEYAARMGMAMTIPAAELADLLKAAQAEAEKQAETEPTTTGEMPADA